MAGDRVGSLLKLLGAVDLPRLVVLACAHTSLPRPPASVLLVRAAGCVPDESLSLPAQLLAYPVPQVHVVACERDPERAAAHLDAWHRVLPEIAAAERLQRRRPGRGAGLVFDLAHPAVPRRVAVGLRPAHRPAFDPTLDDDGRTVAALRSLAAQGRADLTAVQAVPVAERVEVASRPEATDAATSAGVSPTSDSAAGAVEVGRRGLPVGHLGLAVEPSVASELVAEGCTACGVCVRACPHDALTLLVEQDLSTLLHHGESCRAEGQCVRLCPQQALSVVGALSARQLAQRDPVVLATVRTAVCPRCGARHPGRPGTPCQICSVRSEQAFGSIAPAAWLRSTGSGRPTG